MHNKVRSVLVLVALGALTALMLNVTVAGWAQGPAKRPAAKAPTQENRAAKPADRLSAVQRRRARRSRTQFATSSDRAALRIAKRTHRRTTLAEPWRPLRGERPTRFLSNHQAQLAVGGGRRARVTSSIPLRARDETGRLREVDLTLRRTSEGLEPAQAITPTTIGSDARDGLALDRPGVSAAPVGIKGSGAQIVEGKAFYPNIAKDTDWLVMAIPGGAESFTQMRSAAAPEDASLRMEMPQGATLRPAPANTPGGYEIVRDGKVIVNIAPPAAWDATGRKVPVQARVAGERLRIRVAHRSPETTYPVMLDPAVVENYAWRGTASTDFGGWNYDTDSTGKFTAYFGSSFLGNGLYMYNRVTQNYSAGDTRRWYWNNLGYGDAYIYRADLANVYHQPDGQAECFIAGLYNRTSAGVYGANVSQKSCTSISNFPTQQFCANPGCSEGTSGYTSAVFGSRIETGGSFGSFTDYIGGAAIYEFDRVQAAYTTTNFPGSNTWIRSASNLNITATDTGLGMRRIAIDSPDKVDWNQNRNRDFGQCAPRTSRCPRAVQPEPFTSGNLPEGNRSVRATGTDAIGDVTSRSFPLKIDLSPPTGSLVEVPVGINGTTRIAGTMQDSLSGPGAWQLEAQRPGQSTWENVCPEQPPSSNGRYSCDWQSGDYAEGTYGLRAALADRTDPNYGGPNRGQSSRASTKVDRTAPGSPANPRFVIFEEGAGQIAWDQATDPDLADGSSGSGIARYDIRSRRAGGTWQRPHSISASGRLSEDDFDHPANTTLEFEIVAVDAAGNRSAAVTASGQVPGTLPEIDVDPIGEKATDYVGDDQVTFEAKAWDTGVGVREAWVRFDSGGREQIKPVSCAARTRPDGRPWSASCPQSAPFSFALDARRFAEGSHQVLIGAVDRAGNEYEDASDFFVDRTPPTAPTEIHLFGYEPRDGTVGLAWDEGDDPELSQDVPGSSIARSEYRVTRFGNTTPWYSPEDDATVLSNTVLGERIKVEVRSIDEVGNFGPITERTLIVTADLPDEPTTDGGSSTRASGNCGATRQPAMRVRGNRVIANFIGGCKDRNFSYAGVRILAQPAAEELDEDNDDGPREGVFGYEANALCKNGRTRYSARFLILSPGAPERDYFRQITRTYTCGADDQDPCLSSDYKSFIRSNFKFNLCVKTRRTYVGGRIAQAHHMLPVALETTFKDIDPSINIHDASTWGSWWRQPGHGKLSTRYNRQWAGFLRRPGLDRRRIVEYACARAREYKLQVYFGCDGGSPTR